MPGATATGAVLVATTSTTDFDPVRPVTSVAVAVMVNSSPCSAVRGAWKLAVRAPGVVARAPSHETAGRSVVVEASPSSWSASLAVAVSRDR